jgi:hypothetical protein
LYFFAWAYQICYLMPYSYTVIPLRVTFLHLICSPDFIFVNSSTNCNFNSCQSVQMLYQFLIMFYCYKICITLVPPHRHCHEKHFMNELSQFVCVLLIGLHWRTWKLKLYDEQRLNRNSITNEARTCCASRQFCNDN